MRTLDKCSIIFNLTGLLIMLFMMGKSYAAPAKEINIQVSIEFKDFDGDGISDNMEIVVYGTDPMVSDTDSDEYDDGTEILAGSDPLNPLSKPIRFNIQLSKGFNMISAPTNADSAPNAFTLLAMIDNDGTVVDKIYAYDKDSGHMKEAFFDQYGTMGGDNFIINAGEGLIITVKGNMSIELSQHQCPVFDLKAGMNLVGTPCQSSSMSAFALLNSIGDMTQVSSIQQFIRTTGQFETASYDQNGQPVGVDFSIEPGDGFFIYMKQDISGFRP